MGLAELAVVAEECAAAGVPLLLFSSRRPSAARSSPGSPPPSSAPVAAPTRQRRGQDGLCHHRARRRLQQPPDLDDGRSVGGRLPDQRHESTTSRGWTRRPRSSSSPAPGSTRPLAAPRSASSSSTRTHRPRGCPAPRRDPRPGEAVHAVLRRRCGGPLALHRRRGSGAADALLRPQPERVVSAAVLNGVSRYALDKAARYANERQVWGCRSAPTRGSPTHWPRRRSPSSWHGSCATRRRGSSTRGRTQPRRPTWRSSPPPTRQGSPSTGPSRPTGQRMATEYGLATLWGIVRLLKVAPVSREMLLNFVAQRTLGLPRSY